MEGERTEQELQRRQKLTTLRSQGIEPYQSRFDRTHSSAQALALFEQVEKTGGAEARSERVALAGRLVAIRVMGKATFAHIQDFAGRIQLLAKVDKLGDEPYKRFTDLDLGDIVGVHGTLFRTKRGEITCEIEDFVLLAKALRPLPEKYHGLKDKELRYRQRYLDLIANPEVMDVFLARSRMVEEIRTFMKGRGFVEVETPVLQPLAGGAAARPFRTHHNALDMDLYLRIAPELYLKRLVVGGFDRVYEINRNFRNEGLGWRWNPEFTMLEFYQAYTDYQGVMDLTQEIITQAAKDVNGTTKAKWGDAEIDWANWQRLTMREAIIKHWPRSAGPRPSMEDFASASSVDELALRLDVFQGFHHDSGDPPGTTIAALFEAVAEEQLVQPTIIYEFPTAISPLSKQKPDEPDWTERWEIYAGQMEISNGFSELNDPEDQRRRFEAQLQERARGDEEAHQMDEDYIRALSYGMPPAGGVGVGVDRLCMLLTDSHTIRDVILFPLLRPEKSASPDETE
jgi:lysyl-tRNA synthetase, class II